jgi:hypothetical protein
LLFGRQRVRLAPGQFVGGGGRAQVVQAANGGGGQGVDAGAALRVGGGDAPRQEAAQRLAFKLDGEGAVAGGELARGGVDVPRRGAGAQTERRLQRGVQAVMARRLGPVARGLGLAGQRRQGRAGVGAVALPPLPGQRLQSSRQGPVGARYSA